MVRVPVIIVVVPVPECGQGCCKQQGCGQTMKYSIFYPGDNTFWMYSLSVSKKSAIEYGAFF